MPGQGVGGLVYLSDEDENVSRVSTAGRAYFSDSYDRVKLHSPINVSSASGGTQLESAPVGRVYLRSESGNGIMWWGGTSDDAPYSGHGFPLFGGETSPSIPVTNFSAIHIVSSVSGQIIYPIGFLNGQDITLSNTVPTVPDTVAPFIVSHSPVSGLSGVALNSDISVRFNEIISPSSVVSGVFRLSPAHDVTVFRDTSNPTDTVLRPNVNLSGSTVYFATLVSGTITDLAGNACMSGIGFPFTTTNSPPPPDVTPPTISGITPVSGATAVALTISPTVLFSEQMLSGTINTTNIFMATTSGAASPGDITTTVTLDSGDRKTVTIDPASDLTEGNTYYINITTGVQDLATNAMASAITNHPFSTTYNFTELYNVNSTSSSTNIGTSDEDAAGLKLSNSTSDIAGESPKRVIMKLARGSTQTTGTATLKIYNGETLVGTFGTFDTSVLTTTAQDITITNLDNTEILDSGWQLLLFYTGPGAIKMYRSGSDNVGGVRFATLDSGTFSDSSSSDPSWKVYS